MGRIAGNACGAELLVRCANELAYVSFLRLSGLFYTNSRAVQSASVDE